LLAWLDASPLVFRLYGYSLMNSVSRLLFKSLLYLALASPALSYADSWWNKDQWFGSGDQRGWFDNWGRGKHRIDMNADAEMYMDMEMDMDYRSRMDAENRARGRYRQQYDQGYSDYYRGAPNRYYRPYPRDYYLQRYYQPRR